MALKDKWVNKVDGVDDVLADDINAIAGEVIQTQQNIPTKVSALINDAGYLTKHQDISGKADITYVDEELAKKQDKELEWQILTDTTLTEDARIKLTLPENCVGLRVRIRVPKEIELPSGQMFPRSNATWIYGLYFSTFNANTAQDKLIAAEWTQEHGTWVYDCKVRTGTGSFNGGIIYSFPETDGNGTYKYSLSTFPALDELEYNQPLKAGTIIKVWGLIKE